MRQAARGASEREGGGARRESRQIRCEDPETQVSIFSMHEDELFVGDWIAAGARAQVLKSESGARVLDAVDALSQREPLSSPRVAGLEP